MTLVHRKFLAAAGWLIAAALLLTSCRSQATPPTVNPVISPTPASLPSASSTPAATPTAAPRSLVVCLGQEPATLYPYGQASATLWSVLDAVYPGPINMSNYALQPVILQKIPRLEDKDAVIQPVEVKNGDTIVDANGNLVSLAKGVKVNPSGCTGQGCGVAYDGQSPLKLDRMVVTFKLLPGLTWSDGKPLTAADSVYSSKLAADQATPVSKYKVARTAQYTAPDNLTTVWTGVPGYIDPDYGANFWLPLPQHAWANLKPADLLTAEASAEKPIGWGPYVIDRWVKGDHITLRKNPNYAGVKDGLPKFDNLVFRFLGTNSTANLDALLKKQNANVDPLLTGECDIVDQSAHLEDQLETLNGLASAKKLQAVYGAGPEWEHLDFGIKPASYDDSYNPAAGDRPDFFSDPRTRQAFAYCSNRQAVVDKLLFKHSSVPDTFLPPGHPLLDPNVKKYAYNPDEGKKLLDEVGWKDSDNDPSTPREAKGVSGVPEGTPFTVHYATTQAGLRKDAASLLAGSLAECGIKVQVDAVTPGELFGPGPDGMLFGRKFDLAAFSWEAGQHPACFLYSSARIPDAADHWVGEDISGYASQAFDQACQASMAVLPGQAGYAESQAKAQEIFSQDLPVIPLYTVPRVAAARTDVCGFELDPSARSEFGNIAAIDMGPACKK